MITTEFYDGQGLGNQLWCYITTRVIALDRGYDFGIEHREKFKGMQFLDIDFGRNVENIKNYYEEKRLLHPLSGADIPYVRQRRVNVADNTKLEGLLQDEQYIIHRKEEKYENGSRSKKNTNVSIMQATISASSIFAARATYRRKISSCTKKYWREPIANMRNIQSSFQIRRRHEDVKNAKKFFPDFEVYHWDIAKDYVVINNAHYLILSNSSFAQFPAWTSDTLKYAIAPKYWGRHNISDGYWSSVTT